MEIWHTYNKPPFFFHKRIKRPPPQKDKYQQKLKKCDKFLMTQKSSVKKSFSKVLKIKKKYKFGIKIGNENNIPT